MNKIPKMVKRIMKAMRQAMGRRKGPLGSLTLEEGACAALTAKPTKKMVRAALEAYRDAMMKTVLRPAVFEKQYQQAMRRALAAAMKEGRGDE